MAVFEVEGMTCGHCVEVVTQAIKHADPGATIAIDRPAGLARVTGLALPADIAAAITAVGYPSKIVD